MKKILAYVLTLAVMCCFFSVGFVSNANFNSEDITQKLDSFAYYMVSLDDGTEIFSKNENEQIQPAAFNKLLAAIVAIESWGSLDEEITVTEDSLKLIPNEYGIKTAKIRAGDTYTKRQLVECLIVYSANDVLSIIAYDIAQTKEAFIEKMQQLAEKIGCKNTKVVDMFGFDAEGQYTTAKDVSEMIKYGLNNPAFTQAFQAKTVTMPATNGNAERTYPCSNRMTNSAVGDYYHASVTGGKQSTTTQSGESIAVTSSQDGYTYLTIVMKGELKDVDEDNVDENTCMTDAKKMINWVYSNVSFHVVAAPGQIVTSVELVSGRGTDQLKLTPEKEVSALVPSNVSSSSVLIKPIEGTIPEKVSAPVKEGDIIGQAKVMYANEEIATVNLVAYESVKLSMFGMVMNTLRSILKSKLVIALEIIALIVLVCFLIIKLNAMNGKSDAKNDGNIKNAKQTGRIGDPQSFKFFNNIFGFLKSEKKDNSNKTSKSHEKESRPERNPNRPGSRPTQERRTPQENRPAQRNRPPQSGQQGQSRGQMYGSDHSNGRRPMR